MLVATRLAAGFRDEVIISPDPRICMQRGSQCSAHIVFYDLEHCVVLLGVEGHRACIMDPTQGYVTVNYDWFKYLYEQCGSMALAIA